MQEEFKPQIVGFLCNWCSYTGADLAGATKQKIPASLSVIKVMCSGRVEPVLITTAYLRGADGVLVAGCHPGDCHYIAGNYKAARRISLLKRMLDQFGIEGERVRLEWVSASEGSRFAEVVSDFTQTVKELGPNPLRKQDHESI